MTAKRGKYAQSRPLERLAYHIQAHPQKRGKKSYYQGSRLEFLSGYREEYASLRGKSRHQFWLKVFNEWWKRYPWRLQDHEEPPTDNPEMMAELALAVDASALEEKAAVEKRARDVSWPMSSALDRLMQPPTEDHPVV